MDALLRTVTADIPAPDGFRAAFVRGFQRQGGDKLLGDALVNGYVHQGGSVKVLRVSPGKDGAQALVRAVSPSGLSYFDLSLRRDAEGRVRVADAYIFLSGESVAASSRRGYLMGVAEARQRKPRCSRPRPSGPASSGAPREAEGFERFVKSGEYRAWKKRAGRR